MQFNPGDGSGIVDEIDDLCDSDSTEYSLVKKARRCNTAVETIEMWIHTADGTWQFDDNNNTDLPIATFTLTEGQSSYSFSERFMSIEQVFVKDVGGKWHRIDPLDQSEYDADALANMEAQSGFPSFYDKIADTIKFNPAPTASACTLASGGKIVFKRTASLFASTDTTKEPGFASPFHIMVAKMAALSYCKSYKKDRVAQLMIDIEADRKALLKFYAQRQRDTRGRMTMSPPRRFR